MSITTNLKQLLPILCRLAQSGVYSVFPEGVTGQKVQVYCHMTEIPGCGKGGWTLVMKIDGAKVKNKNSYEHNLKEKKQ